MYFIEFSMKEKAVVLGSLREILRMNMCMIRLDWWYSWGELMCFIVRLFLVMMLAFAYHA